MVSNRVIFGAFLFLFQSIFLYFGGVFNKTIIPFALVGYEIGYSQLGPTSLVSYLLFHIQRALMELLLIISFAIIRTSGLQQNFHSLSLSSW